MIGYLNCGERWILAPANNGRVMSIEFTMWRISPSAYESATSTGVLSEPGIENARVGKAWDILTRILANGNTNEPPLAAQSIAGGTVLASYEDMDYGGLRVLSPDLVTAISTDLATVTAGDVERRYQALDFGGAYGAEGSAPASPVERYVDAFEAVRDFYAEAAEARDAMAIMLG
jgi:hypothetical protein